MEENIIGQLRYTRNDIIGSSCFKPGGLSLGSGFQPGFGNVIFLIYFNNHRGVYRFYQ